MITIVITIAAVWGTGHFVVPVSILLMDSDLPNPRILRRGGELSFRQKVKIITQATLLGWVFLVRTIIAEARAG